LGRGGKESSITELGALERKMFGTTAEFLSTAPRKPAVKTPKGVKQGPKGGRGKNEGRVTLFDDGRPSTKGVLIRSRLNGKQEEEGEGGTTKRGSNVKSRTLEKGRLTKMRQAGQSPGGCSSTHRQESEKSPDPHTNTRKGGGGNRERVKGRTNCFCSGPLILKEKGNQPPISKKYKKTGGGEHVPGKEGAGQSRLTGFTGERKRAGGGRR